METDLFVERFNLMLDKLGLNANQFAKKLGFDRPEKIYNIVKGKYKPSFDIIEAIANKFVQINLHWLLTGKGDIYYDYEKKASFVNESKSDYTNKCIVCDEKDKHIADLKTMVSLQADQINSLVAKFPDANNSLKTA